MVEMKTGTMVRLCDIDKLVEGEPSRITVEGRGDFAIYKVEGEIYVTDDLCTHGQASLSEDGELDGFKIICSWHDGSFDIRTGEPLARPCTQALRIHQAIIEEGAVYIAL